MPRDVNFVAPHPEGGRKERGDLTADGGIHPPRADHPNAQNGGGLLGQVDQGFPIPASHRDVGQGFSTRGLPKWVSFDTETLTGKVEAMPTREDVDLSIAEHMIVELYSK